MESRVNSECSRGFISVIISEPVVAACEPAGSSLTIVRAMGLAASVCPQEGAVGRGTALSVCWSSCPQRRGGWRGRAGYGSERSCQAPSQPELFPWLQEHRDAPGEGHTKGLFISFSLSCWRRRLRGNFLLEMSCQEPATDNPVITC